MMIPLYEYNRENEENISFHLFLFCLSVVLNDYLWEKIPNYHYKESPLVCYSWKNHYRIHCWRKNSYLNYIFFVILITRTQQNYKILSFSFYILQIIRFSVDNKVKKLFFSEKKQKDKCLFFFFHIFYRKFRFFFL